MARRVLPFLVLLGPLAVLGGCSLYQKPQRPAWRTAAENACFAQKRVQVSAYVQLAREISGPSICGLTRPLKVVALQGGAVQFNTTATLDCSMVAELDNWVAETVQPAAQARFGMNVVQIDTMGSYSCRGMNNQIGARLSEHAFGNALDIGGFTLADGRKIVIRRDWTRGDEQTQAFLRDTQRGACEIFTTVLAPGSNGFHYDHIHVDLAMHGNSSRGLRRICKPAPQNVAPPPRRDDLPEAPDVEEETDIAQVKTLPGSDMLALRSGPALATPPAPLPPMRATGAPLAMHAGGATLDRTRTRDPLAPPPRPSASLRDDGAFEPPDDDVVSTSRRR